MVTLKTVAVEAGVAPSTVSRVLSGDETCYISEVKKNRIFEVSKRLNYSPNFSARNLATGRTFNIAYVLCLFSHLESVDDKNSPVYRMIDNIHASLKEKGYILSVITVDYDDTKELENICEAARLYDGLLFAKGVVSPGGADIVEKSLLPALVIDDNRPWLKNISRVVTDKSQAVSGIIAHLKELGHEKIGFYGFGEHLDYFKEGLKENGLKFNEDLNFELKVEDNQHIMLDSYISADKVLKSLDGMSAVFCTNDFSALGLCRRLSREGIDIGNEISVVGFDNIEEMLRPDERKRFLTTVKKPYEAMGSRAAEILLETLEAPERETAVENIPCEIVLRKSTGKCNFNSEGKK